MFDENILVVLIDVAVVFLLLYMINKMYNSLEQENIASRIVKGSIVLAFSIAILSSLLSANAHDTVVLNLLFFILDIFIVLSLLILSLKINDKIMFKSIHNKEEISKNNISVSLVEAATTLGTSIIIFTSMYGEGSYLSGFVFFVLGQISLFLMVFIYEKSTHFNALEEIQNDNKSVAIVLASILVGFSIALGTIIYGDSSSSLANDLIYFLSSLLMYIVFLYLFLNRLLDKIFFPACIVEDELKGNNIQIAISYAFVKFSFIIILAFVIRSAL